MGKKRIGLESHIYAAPHAESVKLRNEGLLCASPSEIDFSGANIENMDEINGEGW